MGETEQREEKKKEKKLMDNSVVIVSGRDWVEMEEGIKDIKVVDEDLTCGGEHTMQCTDDV